VDARFTKNLAVSVVLLILSVACITATLKVAQRSGRLIEAKRELVSLQQQKSNLEKEVQYQQSPEFVELEARNKLNMVKPGEEVYLRPKILGDDLLGVQSGRDGATDSPLSLPQRFFASVTTRVTSLFDKIRDFLLLFQS